MNKRQAMPAGRQGFTLIEMLLVVAMLLVFVGIGIPFYSRFYTQNSVLTIADKIVQNVRKAQFYAMESRKSNTSGWGVNYDSNVLTLYQGNSYATRNTTWDETFSFDNTVTITGLSDINFYRMTGTPSATATILVNGGKNESVTLTLNSQGMITR